MPIRLNVWFRVVSSASNIGEAVRVEDAGGGSFLVLFRKSGVVYDNWCVSLKDVERMLVDHEIDWSDETGDTEHQ